MKIDGEKRSRFSRSLFASILLITFSSTAHDSLYNYIEVRPESDGTLRIEFTVHAAELVPGVDPNSTDLLWIETRPDVEVESLLSLAREFVVRSYICSMPSGSEIVFPDCKTLRVLARDADAPRPGCIVATAILSKLQTPIPIQYSEGASKRLMLVTTKPGAFPKVTDLAPGESFEIAFP